MKPGSELFEHELGTCVACKIKSMPLPGGDLGLPFLSGVILGMNATNEQVLALKAQLCKHHSMTFDAMLSADAGMLKWLGIKP